MEKTLLILSFLTLSFTQAQIVNIPDVNFKNALLSASTSFSIARDINGHYMNIDVNNDNEIQNSEVENIYRLDVNQMYINDLTGIETFINLTALHCADNQLTNLDVSQNMNLTYLWCVDNLLTNLDVSQNTNLTKLYCFDNQLTNLDVSQNTNLTTLHCSGNHLTNLDVSQNTNLTFLDCSSNSLTNLDVSQNINLNNLICATNYQLGNLDISQNISLIQLICSYNQLTNIDVSQNINLTNLDCDGNQLTSLDASQNINLTDLSCHNNPLTNLDISQNTNLTSLGCSNTPLTNLGVSQNTNLVYLYCSETSLTNLDISQNINLTSLRCVDNPLTNLDISHNINLTFLYCYDNQLTSLDVSQNTKLIKLECYNNQLTSLDVSQNVDLRNLKCNDNPDLSYINLKNGNNALFYTNYRSSFHNLPNLQNVCVDELNTNLTAFINTEVGHPVTFTEYCSFEPAQSNIISGTTHIDIDLNGCDANDITLANMLIMADNGTESFGTMTQTDGSYSVFTNEGDFNTSLTTNLPDYFTAIPSSISNTFTGFDNTFTADFCVAPNQTVNDVNISLIPISQARPGFDTTYQIFYKNVGTTVLNGDVTINFDDSKLTFLNASETPSTQTSNSLNFNYTNLNPFETRTVNLEFNIIAPPTVNVGDVLSFTTNINPIAGDYTTDDNTFMLNQTVIGSYDPNDITCLEGNQVLFAESDKYLHYIIRFQNKGTADAINVVVKNTLDDKLDWNTLQLETTSHQNRVAIKNGNQIEFIFENIHLPDETTDEAGSHGYIAYKIKPKSTVVLNDIIHNQANIFFDYNEAVPTNTASTQFVNTLAVKEANLLAFSVYPTPTSNLLSISSKTTIEKIEIYTKLGQLVISNSNQNSIAIANLSQGLYFCKVTDEFGNSGIQKVIKK